MRNMRSHEEHEKQPCAPAWSRSCRIARAICAETRRPLAAREERREPMRAEPANECGISSLSWRSSPPRIPVALAGNDNPVGRGHGNALAAGRRPCKCFDLRQLTELVRLYTSSLGAGVARNSLWLFLPTRSPQGHWAGIDAAWQEIAGNFGSDPAESGAARRQLASALLSIASEDSRNAEVLKRAALERRAPRL